MSLSSIALMLFLIIDPIGKVSSFLTVLDNAKNRNVTIIRESFFALLIMVLFNYIGEGLFSILGLSETTLRIASGLILFLLAIRILFPSKQPAPVQQGEPFLVPIAIPMIAGPGVLASIMLFARLTDSEGVMLGAIAIAWAASALILFFSSSLKRILGPSGLIACEKLMALVLIMLAIQRLMDGITLFVQTQAP